MNNRIKRTHKPTEKFLKFCGDDGGNKCKKNQDSMNTSKFTSLNITTFDEVNSKIPFKGFSKNRKSGVQSARSKLHSTKESDKDLTTPVLMTDSPSLLVRRSNREPKTNSKFKEYLHNGLKLKENYFTGFDEECDAAISPSKSHQLKVEQKALVESVEDARKNAPIKNLKLLTRAGTSSLNNSMGPKIIMPVQKPLENLRSENKISLKRSFPSDINSRPAKIPKLQVMSKELQKHITEESELNSIPASNLNLNLPNNSRVSSSSEDSVLKSNIPQKMNNSSVIPKNISDQSNLKIKPINREKPVLLINKLKDNKPSYDEIQSQLNTSKNTIRDSLKKFLVMGTKVANVISETLKHNEEELLSSSSAFEKKCLSIVHVLAASGKDLEEGDMEKILTLLDEEQAERRSYRQAFLESLRISHLTNMALYSQMLRLLKTL